MSSHTHFAWSTSDELAYITSLDQARADAQRLTRREMLARYFHATRQRKNLGGMDRTAVMKAIHAAMVETDNAD